MLMRVPVSTCRGFMSVGGPLDRLLLGVPVGGRSGGVNGREGGGTVRGRASGVSLRLWRDEEAVRVEADLPGIRAEDVQLDVTSSGVSLRAVRRIERPEGATLLRGERSSWTVARSFELPVEVDVDRVEAELRDGVLHVTLPVSASARPRRVRVAGGGDLSPRVVDERGGVEGACCRGNGGDAAGSSAGSSAGSATQTAAGSACCGQM